MNTGMLNVSHKLAERGVAMTPGSKLGACEIVGLIGAGGMGKVYRARDLRLKREVAIKILPEEFSRDVDRVSRFQREAEVLASLNHPNIAAIHDLAESNGIRYLVLELVDGETLADMIARGPIPVEESLAIAKQICEALEAAHERGIVHRDLKPANVKLTPEGQVKVLDFGLAKAISNTNTMASNSPTLLSGTMGGMLIGTAAYMSPEQATGKAVDKRADIWSFGVVLWEMLAGQQLFRGETVSHILASVLKDEPDLSRVPLKARGLLWRCLEKDPRKRLRDIGDVRILLEDSSPAHAPVLAPKPAWPGWTMAVALAVVAAVFAMLSLWPVPQMNVAKLYFPPPAKGMLATTGFPALAVSPNGQHFVFEAGVDGRRGLWLRDLDNSTPRLLSEFESANRPETPFWAPDSRRLAFFQGGQLKTIDITSGPAIAIANPNFRTQGTGSWSRDDVIVFSPVTSPALWRVAAVGGSPAPVTELDQSRNETGHTMPWFLPDGRHFLYLAISTDPTKTGVFVGDLNSRTRKQVLGFGTRAIYVNPGYLLYVRDRTLLAQPFDTDKLETTGDVVPVAEEVDTGSNLGVNIGSFSASQNGVLAYTSGGIFGSVQLTWFDHAGNQLDTVGPPGDLSWFSLSPDGSRVAFSRRNPRTYVSEIWTRDLAHNSELRLTSTGSSEFPIWSWNSALIYFVGYRNAAWKLYAKNANNTGQEMVLEDAFMWPADASRNYLLAETPPGNRPTGQDIWMLPLSGEGKPTAYLNTEFAENQARLSPNGLWLAYRSNESGPQDVYVVSFPQLREKHKVSTDGGGMPAWSHNGRELYYLASDGKIMAVEIPPGEHLQPGIPKPLFRAHMVRDPNIRFEVSADGRFLLPAAVEQDAAAPMNVVLNWPQLLRKK
jgi:serine/threonine protein kinase